MMHEGRPRGAVAATSILLCLMAPALLAGAASAEGDGAQATSTVVADLDSAFVYDPSRSLLSEAMHQRVAAIMELYYNFEFEEAVARARELRDHEPHRPAGHFMVAEAFWWQFINNADDPYLLREFETASRQTVKLCERMLDRDKRDALALFFLAGSHGRQAILAALNGRHFAAVQASLTGRKYTQRLAKYHPEIDDAYFGLGLYDYYAVQLPWFARVLSRLFLGLAGNTERGIWELQRAAKHGLFTQVESKLFLAIIYLDEGKRYADALEIFQELNQRYPKNLDYYGALAYAYRTQYDHANAIRMLETLIDRATPSPTLGQRSLGMSHYFLGSTYKVAGQFDEAVQHLDRVIKLSSSGDTNWLLAIAHLERGRALDLLGQRDKAIADYHRVVELKDFRGTRDRARDCLKQPHVAPEEERAYYLTATLPADGTLGEDASASLQSSGVGSGTMTGADVDVGPETAANPD